MMEMDYVYKKRSYGPIALELPQGGGPVTIRADISCEVYCVSNLMTQVEV